MFLSHLDSAGMEFDILFMYLPGSKFIPMTNVDLLLGALNSSSTVFPKQLSLDVSQGPQAEWI